MLFIIENYKKLVNFINHSLSYRSDDFSQQVAVQIELPAPTLY